MVSEINIDNLQDYKDLSYYETGLEYVDLYHLSDFIGYLEVWTDKENNNREYIIINNEIVYLDTITKLND